MSLRRFMVLPVVLVLVSGCGETSLEPATPDEAVANARGAPSASGSGHFIDDSDSPGVEAALRNFAFTAFSDGRGQTQLVNRHVGIRLHGNVECVTVEDGNKAWIAMTITQSSNPAVFPIGSTRGFNVVDNGRGKSGVLDQITRSVQLSPQIFPGVPTTPAGWCLDTPIFLVLHDIEVGGNITVRP